MNSDVLFFGVWTHDVGHYLYSVGGHRMRENHLPKDFPIRWQILDASLLPPGLPQVEGRAALWHFNAWTANSWTILSFWDRSGDSRMNSNSAFVLRGNWDLEGACRAARDAFPEIWGRFKFQVLLPGGP
jgi:hypothetical protein